MKIAILITVHNRKNKTLACLDSLEGSHQISGSDIDFVVFLTDDGCTDGTSNAVKERHYPFQLIIIPGTGKLYWNGGMILSWKAAISYSNEFDGYLWLNDDTIVLPEFWMDLKIADELSVINHKKKGIYVGSTYDSVCKKFTYGGFKFVNKWTLKDEFVYPNNSSFQECQCAHGNITYISNNIVKELGVFYEGYIHGAGDHDYTYRAYKSGFPVLVMPHYAGICDNDHKDDGYADFFKMSVKERITYLYSPFGFNLHNTLLFQKRCFPHRYLFVGIMGYLKALFPNLYFYLYRKFRGK